MNTQAAGKPLDMQHLIAAHRSGTVTRSTQVNTSAPGNGQVNPAPFSEVLKSKIDGIRLAHAATRIKSRNMELTPEIMDKLEKVLSGAAKKVRGILYPHEESGVYRKCPEQNSSNCHGWNSIRENVFTNIDSAVIAE